MEFIRKHQLVFIALWLILLTFVLVYTAMPPSGINVGSTNQKIVTDRSGRVLSVLAGGDLEVLASATEVHAGAESHSGSVAFTGPVQATVINVSGVLGNVTPVATATALSAYLHSETTNYYIKCTNSSVVAGSLTATPVSGATPVGNPWATMNTITYDDSRVAAIYATGVFTVSVYNDSATPTPATTTVPVEWCYIYTK